ncbi:MAG TPA: flagellar hook-length control protein FliK [Burkholderiaceae bacterium]|nr:flagellar hook-length control protein FliK [Burkholderiaceae bacterium]
MDLGTIAAAVLRPGAPVGLRDERIAVSLRLIGSLLGGRARLSEISPDLAREVSAAAADAQATLILPAGPGPARIELGGRQFVLPTALRDALVALLSGAAGQNAPRSAAPTSAASAAAANTQMRLPTQALVLVASAGNSAADAAAANALASSGALRSARNEAVKTPAQATTFEAPVLDPREPASTAARLAARVAGSGVFFEAHVAQWMRGDRSTEAVHSEAQQLARAAIADPARAETRTALQLDALHRDTISLSGPAWLGQPMLLELGRDPQVLPDGANGASENAQPVFVARLHLDLPRLGSVEIRLRLAGESIAATVASSSATGSMAELERALPDFASALAARGLRPVLLQALASAEEMV